MAAETVSVVNKHVLPLLAQELKLKAYSSFTAKTYLNEMSQLIKTIGNVPADTLTADELPDTWLTAMIS